MNDEGNSEGTHSEGSDCNTPVPEGFVWVGFRLIERTWENFLSGAIPITELDDDELSKLRLRNREGNLASSGPRSLPRSFVQSHARELVSRNETKMKEHVLKATQVYIDIIESDTASPADKMKAAEYLQNRVLGKVPDRVQLTAEVKPWQGLVTGILVDDGEKDPVVEESGLKQIEP